MSSVAPSLFFPKGPTLDSLDLQRRQAWFRLRINLSSADFDGSLGIPMFEGVGEGRKKDEHLRLNRQQAGADLIFGLFLSTWVSPSGRVILCTRVSSWK